MDNEIKNKPVVNEQPKTEPVKNGPASNNPVKNNTPKASPFNDKAGKPVTPNPERGKKVWDNAAKPVMKQMGLSENDLEEEDRKSFQTNENMNPNNPKYNGFEPSSITNAKSVHDGYDFVDADTGKKGKVSIIEYIPYGSLKDGTNKKLYGVVYDYDGSDSPDIGAEVTPSLEDAKKSLEESMKLHTQGKDRYLRRGKYNENYFNLIRDNKEPGDDERFKEKYGWDFNKPFSEHDFMKNDPYEKWKAERDIDNAVKGGNDNFDDDYREYDNIDDDYERSYGPVNSEEKYQAYLKWKENGDSFDNVSDDEEEVNNKIGGRGFEMDDGRYLNVEFKNGKLYAGSATNSGIMQEYNIDYDNDASLDQNLQNLYDKIIEEDLNNNDALSQMGFGPNNDGDAEEAERAYLNGGNRLDLDYDNRSIRDIANEMANDPTNPYYWYFKNKK